MLPADLLYGRGRHGRLASRFTCGLRFRVQRSDVTVGVMHFRFECFQSVGLAVIPSHPEQGPVPTATVPTAVSAGNRRRVLMRRTETNYGRDTWLTRFVIGGATAAVSAMGCFVYAINLSGGGWNAFEVAAFPLFCLLFSWLAFSFFVSTCGFLKTLRTAARQRRGFDGVEGIASDRENSQLHRSSTRVNVQRPTAVLVPVYNEDPNDVFARVSAMVQSLHQQDRDLGLDRASAFHFYLLSDTTDPEIWLAEESAWKQLCHDLDGNGAVRPQQVFYRHRSDNQGRKAGNIADFVERWSAPYRCMIVLDADSLLEASTMVAMVDAMEADPRLGILQAPPTPVGRESLFARLQQFSAAAYGQICCRGFDAWAGDQGNYWGHNAILRVEAFRESCDLPVLPGKAPLGGEILSHDFVEAALMVRDGWKVRLASDLGGSYEECPTTLTDYAKRDQRWCQGNLQHSYLLASQGFHPISRLHFFSGILSYVASPIWLLWTTLAVAGWISQPTSGPLVSTTTLPSQFTLFLVAGVFLFLPKIYGVIAVVAQGRSKQFGGWFRLGISAVIETVLSILLSPLMAVLHSQFVINTLCGRRVRWNAQNRCEQGVTANDAFADYRWHMLAGVLITISVVVGASTLMVWLTPILVGLVLAVPLAMLLGNQRVGKKLLDWGLLIIPQEAQVPAVYERFQQALFANLAQEKVQHVPRFQQLIERADLFRLHERVLLASEGGVPLSESEKDEIKRFAIRGASGIPLASRRAVLGDQELLNELHRDSNHNGAVTA